MRNDKGSIALVLIIALICGFSILFLTNLTLIERTSTIKADKRMEDSLYQINSIVEATTNLFLQKINTKEIPYEEKTLYVLTNNDIAEIEKAMNKMVIPNLEKKAQIQLSRLTHSTSLEMLCDEIYEENSLTMENESSGVDCDSTFFSIGVHLDIIGTETTSLNLSFNDLFPEESNSGEIQINTSSLKFHLTP